MNKPAARKKRFSLNTKAMLMIVLISVVFCIAALTLSIFTFSRTNEELFKKQARDLAYTASLSVDGDSLKIVADSVKEVFRTIPESELVTSDDWGSPEFDAYMEKYSHICAMPEYISVLETLASVRDGDISALSSIYALYYDTTYGDPLAIYLADAAEEEPCLPGVIDVFNPEDDYNAVIDPDGGIRAYITDTETYGWLCVAGSPIYTSDGRYAAFLAVDLSMNEIKMHETNFSFVLAAVLIVTTIVICVLSLVMIRRSVIDPLDLLSDVAVKYTENDENRRSFSSLGIERSDEIGDLADAMVKMEQDIKTYIDNITTITAEKERVSAELNIAAKMQADMLPTNFPVSGQIDLYASITPAKEVGGDFYDFFFVDSDHLSFVIADVSGKGIPAALFMVIAKSVIRNIIMVGGEFGNIVSVVNNILFENNKSGYFVTAFIGILTITTGEVRYVNAGHEYPVIRRGGGEYTLVKTDNQPPLVTMEDMEYFSDTFTLEKGDELFLYTDGVPDAKAPDGSRFGTDAMIAALNRRKDLSSQELISSLKEEVDAFAGENDPFDDITMMSIIRKA